MGKGDSLREKGKGDSLRDEAKNTIRTLLYQHAAEAKIALFSLKSDSL